jgi:AcrR family transcriptional regulator
MRQLAAELGVSPMTPYRYFADKDAILAAVRARAFNRHAEALEAAFEAGLDPSAARQRRSAAPTSTSPEPSRSLQADVRHQQPAPTTIPSWSRPATARGATMTAHLKAMIDGGVLKGDPRPDRPHVLERAARRDPAASCAGVDICSRRRFDAERLSRRDHAHALGRIERRIQPWARAVPIASGLLTLSALADFLANFSQMPTEPAPW